MKKHLVATVLASFYFGFGLAIQNTGIKAGFGLWPTIIIFSTSFIIYAIVLFTSLQKLKEFIKENDKPQQP